MSGSRTAAGPCTFSSITTATQNSKKLSQVFTYTHLYGFNPKVQNSQPVVWNTVLKNKFITIRSSKINTSSQNTELEQQNIKGPSMFSLMRIRSFALVRDHAVLFPGVSCRERGPILRSTNAVPKATCPLYLGVLLS